MLEHTLSHGLDEGFATANDVGNGPGQLVCEFNFALAVLLNFRVGPCGGMEGIFGQIAQHIDDNLFEQHGGGECECKGPAVGRSWKFVFQVKVKREAKDERRLTRGL